MSLSSRAALCSLSLLTWGAVWACGGSDSASVPVDDAGRPDVQTPGNDAGDGATYPTVTVTGRVVDQIGEGVEKIKVLLVDAVGHSQGAFTGKDGTFTIVGAVLPYDVSIFNTSGSRKRAYLGLTRTDPQFDTYNKSTMRTYPLARYTYIRSTLPAIPGCPKDVSNPKYCLIQVSMSSPDGEVHHREEYKYYQSGDRPQDLYMWHTAAKRLTVKAHLLTQPDAGGPFYHSETTLDVVDEGRLEFTWPDVQMVPRAGSWTVTSQPGTEIPAGWRQEYATAWLNFPNGEGSVYLGSAVSQASSLPITVDVPNLAGATMGASAELWNTASGDAPSDRQVYGAIDAVPVGVPASSLSFVRGERITSPAPSESVTMATGTLSWASGDSPALYELEALSSLDPIIATASNQVSLARLSALDLELPGSYSGRPNVRLTTRRAGISVDDLTGPTRHRIREYGFPRTFTQSAYSDALVNVK